MVHINTSHYFIPPENYFWKWSPDGTAFDWNQGQTLAFSQEVLALLETLADQGGMPPLGTVLLIHAAASGKLSQFEEARDRMMAEEAEAFSSAESKTLIAASSHSLSKIASLPEDLRKGTRAKVKICLALFNRTTWSQTAEKARLLVQDFRSQLPSLWIDQESPISFQQRLLRDTSALIKATAGLSPEGLESLIRTGIELPEIVDPDFEEFVEDADDQRSLIDQLAGSGPELSALAGLARQVIGLIALPLPATRSNDLPIGGVADIVNRGTPDKLLTTELAWGDTILASRLAQNEALYYHRETPPQNTPSERIILLDHGLRYWGVLRLFALATHLGLKNHKKSRVSIEVTNLLAASDSCQSFALETLRDVRAILSKLPTHLDLAPALENLSTQISEKNGKDSISDVFLIASSSALADSQTEQALHKLTPGIREKGGRFYVIEINAGGHLTFFEHRARGVRKLQEGTLDLNELLPSNNNTPPSQKTKAKLTSPNLEKLTGSKFYNHYPPPLPISARPKHGTGIHPNHDEDSLFAMSHDSHVMCWYESTTHATELSQRIPGREQWVGLDEHETIRVATSGDKAGDSARVFTVLKNGLAQEIPIAKTKHAFPRRAVFQTNVVIFIYSDSAEAISLESGKVIATRKANQPNFHTRTIRLINDEIAVTAVAPVDPLTKFAERFPATQSPSKAVIPSQLGFTYDGHFHLRPNRKCLRLDTSKLIWEPVPLPHGKFHHLVNFKETHASRFPGEPPIQQVKVPLGPIFTYDPRGFLHLTNGPESWSLTLNDSPISIWKSRDSDDLRPATKADFVTFLKNLNRTLNP